MKIPHALVFMMRAQAQLYETDRQKKRLLQKAKGAVGNCFEAEAQKIYTCTTAEELLFTAR